jgi:putative Mg2+ transporter-C (MgtC) family protein
MLTFEQMLIRFVVALALGALLGLERELVGKEAAGIRTLMLVTSGASIFAMVALTIPYITAATLGVVPDATLLNSGFAILANIVVGIGFLGAGLIIKTDNQLKTNEQPHGVTTAALVWTAAAIGVLVGIGLSEFAVSAAVIIAILLYVLRTLNVSERFEKK